jgi:hypothetical protein
MPDSGMRAFYQPDLETWGFLPGCGAGLVVGIAVACWHGACIYLFRQGQRKALTKLANDGIIQE